MEYIKEIVERCKVQAIRIKENEKSELTIDAYSNPIQMPWLGKKVGDILTTPSGLSYKVEKIYIGENNEDNKQHLDISKKERKKAINTHTTIKKKNHELNKEPFDYDLAGFGLYLVRRGYSTFSERGANSTCLGYSDALVKICIKENLDFEELCQNITYFAKEYSLEGRKKEDGKNGQGTWRNALKRLEEFVEYQEKYLHRTKTTST